MEKVKEFLNSEQKVFLLMGASGTGKSTFTCQLEYSLWESYISKTGRIPLRIDLPSIDKPEDDMIPKQLQKAGFDAHQISELKLNRKLILICDGYDEIQYTDNLYTSNRLNQPGEWDVQMVIGCCSENLGVDYRDHFQPGDRDQQSSLLQEAVIIPFTQDQMQDYIKQYVVLKKQQWQVKDYNRVLEGIPTNLKELVRNPFLMTLSLEVLPHMLGPSHELSATRVSRVTLYDHFVEQWLERGKKRLKEKELDPQERSAFEDLTNEEFTQHGIKFIKGLAVAIYEKQDGLPMVTYSRVKGEQSWKDSFFGVDNEKKLLREACPLTKSGNQYRFCHRSLLEYALARAIFDPQESKTESAPQSTPSRRGSVTSLMSFEDKTVQEAASSAALQEPDVNSPLVRKNYVNHSSILHFLEERVQQEPIFKQQLLSYIEHSKSDKSWRLAAANAITILVRAGEQFIGANLQGIQIPGADLSYGMFDSANLQHADLRKVNFRGVWLRQADLRGALMKGAQFGELPLLTMKSKARSCAYSRNGESFVVGLDSGDVAVYKTLDWEKTSKWSGRSGPVLRGITFSPNSDQIASASEDKIVQPFIASSSTHDMPGLWDVTTGTCRWILKGHCGTAFSVAYSPQGDLIVSGSDDNSVRLWDAETGARRQVFTGHTACITSVAFSPQGKWIVSASNDKTVRIWDLETEKCHRTITSHAEVL
ncbi:hypothetical protein BGZ65_001304, partial [Modicella reniformis]